MATNQNTIKAKSKSNQQAAIRERFGNDVAELLDDDVNDDWQDIQAFAQEHVSFDD